MITAKVEKLLAESIGLDFATIGRSAVGHVMRQRMDACECADPAQYWSRLQSSPQELQNLIDAVVVSETWFFRDPRAFDVMVNHARQRLGQGMSGPLQLLSLPCATGEEAYSMVMAMFEAGFRPGDFRVDGVDVSVRNIAAARRGVYGRNSFRGAALGARDCRDHYFETVADGTQAAWRLRQDVREQVRLKTGNLFDMDWPAVAGGYDVVFCRNLLIYFDRERQAQALRRLRQLLAPDGLLLVGPAEAGLQALHGLLSLRSAKAFAFGLSPRKEPGKPQQPRLPSQPPVAPRTAEKTSAAAPMIAPTITPAKPIAAWASKPQFQSAAKTTAQTTSAPAPLPMPDTVGAAAQPRADQLKTIEELADGGQLAQARQAALAYIVRHGPSADVFYLLGLACDAEGDGAASVEHYRKALYLDPGHRKALAQLALRLRGQGDAQGARLLSERLRRLEGRDRPEGQDERERRNAAPAAFGPGGTRP